MTGPSAATGRAPMAEVTVLVAVADPETRAQHCGWLRAAGYAVAEAPTAAAALTEVTRCNPAVALLDSSLPDVPGIEVADRIKSQRATEAVPVVLLSVAPVDPQERSSALARSADGYLVRPGESELLATVAALLRYHDARRTAVRLAIRLERLHQATLLMNAAPSVSDLVSYACAGLVSVFGTPAHVLVVRDGNGRMAAGSPNELEPRVSGCWPAQVLEIAEAAAVGAVQESTAYRRLMGAEGPSSVLSSPISTPRGELVGAVLLATPQDASDEVLLMLDHFAQALAVAMENQRLYAVEHQTALTLQRAMLPEAIPARPGLDIAVRYIAASDAVEIGGDFYEAVPLGDDVTLLAVGDVAGHSLHAATVMAELRHSLRAFASLGMSAADIVARLGDLLREAHPGMTATLCIAEIDVRGSIRVTNAGHIPPLVRGPSGTTFVEEHGTLLGVRAARPVPTVSVDCPPGTAVLMVTDGLLERRGEDIATGLTRLQAAVENAPRSVEALADHVVATLTPPQGAFDDIALVAAERLA